jgi:hypothetical protein
MNSNFPASNPKPLKGQEPFFDGSNKLDFNLSDFWSWSFSGLLNNVTRGHLAEFIVAKALEVAIGVRNVWAPYDLLMPTPNGKELKIEVKSASFLQEWEQNDLSLIQFNVRKTRSMNLKTSLYTGRAKRHADVYVFALLKHEIKDTVNPLNLCQWGFYVVPTATLNKRKRSQHSITLKSLEELKTVLKVNYSGLRAAVEKIPALH